MIFAFQNILKAGEARIGRDVVVLSRENMRAQSQEYTKLPMSEFP